MSALQQLAERSGSEFPNLIASRSFTADRLARLRERFATLAGDDDACVAMFGSWGRYELTADSDGDWAILVDGPERERVRPGVAEVTEVASSAASQPGAQGIFGAVVFCDDLVERIGLDRDDNANLTRRMLLMLESVAISNERAHRACRTRALDGYLDYSAKDYRPPRFFLNDLVRYWRTICVDFVGKEREGTGQKWALRNLKLGMSRKALFAGGLLPILLCHRYRTADMPSFLSEAFDRPSIDRLAWAFLELGEVDAGVRALGAYDRFLGMLADGDVRAELALMSRRDAQRSALFQQGRRLGEELQQGLLALLFETPIEPLVREYGIF